MTHPIESLLSLAQTAQNQGVEQEGARLLESGIRRWLQEGGTLDQALGMNGDRGFSSGRTSYLNALRDDYLKQAWASVTDQPVSKRKRSRLLADEIHRFETRLWKRLQYFDEPPSDLSELRSILFQAFKTGCKIPGFERIRQICEPIQ